MQVDAAGLLVVCHSLVLLGCMIGQFCHVTFVYILYWPLQRSRRKQTDGQYSRNMVRVGVRFAAFNLGLRKRRS